jgi:regulator of sigma E protease
MLAILSPILVFGLVIFVHELGHFMAAKLMGVYAPRFSVGFGPALWRRRFGETEYILAALPLGGYVRMASRLDAEVSTLEGGAEEGSVGDDPEAMMPFGPRPVPEHRWFESKPLWGRLFILSAGVAMNALLGLVVCIGLVFSLGQRIVPTTVVGSVTPLAEAPALSAIAAGDTIRLVNDLPVGTWNDVRREVLRSEDSVRLLTSRGRVSVPLGGEVTAARVADAVQYPLPPVIQLVTPGSRAEGAGLRGGDSVVAINGTPIEGWSEMLTAISGSPDRPLTLEVVRGGERQVITVTPRPDNIRSAETGRDTVVGRIGAAVRDVSVRSPIAVGDAVTGGATMAWAMGTTVLGFVRDLFVGRMSIDQLGGPVAITRASVSAARSGLEELFYLIALLSINVGILNLLPIPILDGGQILLNIIESAKGSPFSLRTREYILRVGLIAILMLFAVVMYNDTRGGFARLFAWLFG